MPRLLGVWGMGGIPHSNCAALSLERGAKRSEHRKRGFSSEPRRRTWSPTTNIAVTPNTPLNANRPLLGVWGMGGIPHSICAALSLERGAQRSEHRKRGFSSEPRQKHKKDTTPTSSNRPPSTSKPHDFHLVSSNKVRFHNIEEAP